MVSYAEVRKLFIETPAPEGRAASPVPDSAARRLRDAAEPIATISFWAPEVNERLEALGLHFMTGYVWARTAPMGEPTAPVVVAAFGVFEPDMITALYEEARGLATREQVLHAREQGAVEGLRRLLPDADVSDAVASLRRATGVAAADVAGRPARADYRAIPAVAFTDPEVASVGTTSGDGLATSTYPVEATARASTYERPARAGLVKLFADRRRRVLVGALAVGPEAGEWLGQLTLAVRAEVPIDVLRDTIQPFPTFSEAIFFAARELDV